MELVHRQLPGPPAREWGAAVAPLFTARGGPPWQVVGGPGTGKTALLTDLAVSHIAAGCDPEAVLVLTASRRAAVTMRDALSAGLPGGRRASREPLVRTVHSYAFAVLRLQAAAYGNPPPRLLTSAEQDAVLREMLRGVVADGADAWPERLRPALGMAGFASELRNLMLRCAERGIGPEDLVRLGRKHNRAEWVAAGSFALEYEQATLLRWSVGVELPEASAPALSAAELIGAALSAFAADADLLARERARVRYLLVDDAQHLDPAAAALVRVLGNGAELAVLAGDPDQAVFTFRGAEPAVLAPRDGVRRIVLATDHRASRAVARLTGRLVGRLPGYAEHRGARVAPNAAAGSVAVQVFSSAAREAAAIAAVLRRAHLADDIPWSRMAVIVRSVPLAIAPLRRALSGAGVPVTTAATELPLHRQRGVAWLLGVLRATGTEISGEETLALLSGPLGAADPVALRRLRRGIKRIETARGGDRDSSEILGAILADDPAAVPVAEQLTDIEAAPVRRVRKVLRRVRSVVAAGGSVEDALWAAWLASGLERAWLAASARGGTVGAQADRDLDAVVALFAAAADYVDRLPRSTMRGFVDYIVEQDIPGDARLPSDGAAVTLLSAHASAGREWDVVAVAGVQEGIWPSLRARGSLLGADELVDIVSGVRSEAGERLSRTAPMLADERRLFLVACSRARRTLLVTAVESASGDQDLVPSRFLDDVREHAEDAVAEVPVTESRLLALPAVVAELRAVVCDPVVAEHDPAKHARAAAQLAKLARAGVRFAHPDHWYGAGGTSTDAALWDVGPVALSPSVVELLNACPLRWALERGGGVDGENVRAVTGSLVHTLVQALAGRVPEHEIRAAMEKAWDGVDLGSEWYSRQELRRAQAMLDNFAAWLAATRHELTEAGTEVGVDCVLPARGDDEPAVRIRGRIDRLEHDPDGRPVIIDVKTGKTPVSKDEAARHAQLATYQLAAAAGGIEGEPAAEPGGGRLVYVAKPHHKDGAPQRFQSALDGAALAQWRSVVHEAAAATRGPVFAATLNDGCRHCPVSGSCPVQDSGRQVTDR